MAISHKCLKLTGKYVLSAQIISKNIFIAKLYKTCLQEVNYNGKVYSFWCYRYTYTNFFSQFPQIWQKILKTYHLDNDDILSIVQSIFCWPREILIS